MQNQQTMSFETRKRGLIMKIASFGRKKDGVVSIEAALLFPFMILLLLGMIDISSIISMKRKVTVAASAVVDLTTQQSATVTKAELDQYIQAADAILTPFPSTSTKVELTNYRKNGSNVNPQWSHSRGSCGAGGPTISAENLEKMTEEDNDVLVGRVCLQYKPIAGYLFGDAEWTISEAVAQRPRQGLVLDCSNC